jgi:two-component system chemotaxis response regulator CheB
MPDLFTILLTSGSHREASQAVDALLLGASTLIIKPSGDHAPRELAAALKSAVGGLGRRGVASRKGAERPEPIKSEAAPRELIAVGASTGGPPVVLQFLIDLPANFEVPIVLTQHMPALHVPYFVELLARQSGRRVVIGEHGARVERGCVYVAGDAKHLLVKRDGTGLVLAQDSGPEEHNCRPAVDPMFRSVAQACGAASVGVVMTGMGSDGALGATALRARGAPVVAQDQQSSVVWGMPGAVAAAGAASAVVAAGQLAKCVLRWTEQGGFQS